MERHSSRLESRPKLPLDQTQMIYKLNKPLINSFILENYYI